jgi:hypothetical protein
MQAHRLILLAALTLLGCKTEGRSVSDVEPASSSAAALVPEHRIDADGPGWRLRDGVFESIHEPLRIVPPPGWRIVVAEDTAHPGSAASVVLFKADDGDAALTFTTTVFDAASLTDFRRSRTEFSPSEAMTPLAPISLELFGERIDLDGFSKGQDSLFYGIRFIDALPLELWIHQDGDDLDALFAVAREGLAGVTLLSADERARLRATLEAEPHPQVLFGEDWSVRGGVFRDFAHGVRFTSSSSVWHMEVPNEPPPDANRRLIVTDRGRGIFGMLFVNEGFEGDAAAWHQQVVADAKLPGDRLRGPVEQRSLGAVEARVQTLDHRDTGRVLRLASFLHDGRACLFAVRSTSAIVGTSIAELDEVLAGLEVLDDLEPAEQSGERHVDVRVGFAITPPFDVTPELFNGDAPNVTGTVTKWSRDGEAVKVIIDGVYGAATSPAETLELFVIEVARELGVATPEIPVGMDEPVRIVGEYHGVRTEAAIGLRGQLLFAVWVVSPDSDRFAQAWASFELLD